MYAQLTAEVRDPKALKASKLRRTGWIPANLYSKDIGANPIKILQNQLLKALGSEQLLFEIKVGSTTHLASAQEVQFKPDTGEIIHVAFLAVKRGEASEFTVPINLVGEAVGLKVNGVITQLMNEIIIKAKPKDAPDHLELDITKLDVGGHMTVSGIKLPNGVEIAEDLLSQNLVTCSQQKAEELEPQLEVTEIS